MLVLTRSPGETIKIGNDINVTVLGVKGNQVRIGVEALKEVPVHREEVYERIQREKQQFKELCKKAKELDPDYYEEIFQVELPEEVVLERLSRIIERAA